MVTEVDKDILEIVSNKKIRLVTTLYILDYETTAYELETTLENVGRFDHLLLCYNEKTTVSPEHFSAIVSSRRSVKTVQFDKTGDISIQIASMLGFLVSESTPKISFVIVSDNPAYKETVKYWREKGKRVFLREPKREYARCVDLVENRLSEYDKDFRAVAINAVYAASGIRNLTLSNSLLSSKIRKVFGKDENYYHYDYLAWRVLCELRREKKQADCLEIQTAA